MEMNVTMIVLESYIITHDYINQFFFHCPQFVNHHRPNHVVNDEYRAVSDKTNFKRM